MNKNLSSAPEWEWIMSCTMACWLLLLVRRANFILHRHHYSHWYHLTIFERSLFICYVLSSSCTIVQHPSMKARYWIFIFKISHWTEVTLISLKDTVNIFTWLLFIITALVQFSFTSLFVVNVGSILFTYYPDSTCFFPLKMSSKQANKKKKDYYQKYKHSHFSVLTLPAMMNILKLLKRRYWTDRH